MKTIFDTLTNTEGTKLLFSMYTPEGYAIAPAGVRSFIFPKLSGRGWFAVHVQGVGEEWFMKGFETKEQAVRYLTEKLRPEAVLEREREEAAAAKAAREAEEAADEALVTGPVVLRKDEAALAKELFGTEF